MSMAGRCHFCPLDDEVMSSTCPITVDWTEPDLRRTAGSPEAAPPPTTGGRGTFHWRRGWVGGPPDEMFPLTSKAQARFQEKNSLAPGFLVCYLTKESGVAIYCQGEDSFPAWVNQHQAASGSITETMLMETE